MTRRVSKKQKQRPASNERNEKIVNTNLQTETTRIQTDLLTRSNDGKVTQRASKKRRGRQVFTEGNKRIDNSNLQTETTGSETALLMQSKRTNDGTKRNYKSKLNVMKIWMMQHHPTAIKSNNELSIPVPKKAVIEFFGELSAKAAVLSVARDQEVADLPTPMSASTIKGYRSALVDLYRDNQKELDKKRDLELMNIINGYEKVINELKQRGRMSISEGRRHLKWSGYILLAEKFMSRIPKEGSHGQSWSTVVFAWAFFIIM
jgi:hypothetical protein